jgi:hypothetical protein
MRGDVGQGDDQPEAEHGSDHRNGPSARTLLIAAIILVVGGYFLTTKLRDMARIQDCVASGRTNCAPISTGADK